MKWIVHVAIECPRGHGYRHPPIEVPVSSVVVNGKPTPIGMTFPPLQCRRCEEERERDAGDVAKQALELARRSLKDHDDR